MFSCVYVVDACLLIQINALKWMITLWVWTAAHLITHSIFLPPNLIIFYSGICDAELSLSRSFASMATGALTIPFIPWELRILPFPPHHVSLSLPASFGCRRGRGRGLPPLQWHHHRCSHWRRRCFGGGSAFSLGCNGLVADLRVAAIPRPNLGGALLAKLLRRDPIVIYVYHMGSFMQFGRTHLYFVVSLGS